MKKIHASHIAAMLFAAMLFSCTTDIAPLPPPGHSSSSTEEEPAGTVLCLFSGVCVSIPAELCSEVSGVIVQSCPANSSSSGNLPSSSGTYQPSSSSGLPAGTVLCQFGNSCYTLDEATCILLGGSAVQFCSIGSSSSVNSSSSYFIASSSSNGGDNINPGTGAGPVSYYGKLKASGSNIIGSKTGTAAVQVRGVSLFWSNTGWGGDAFFNAATVNAMVDNWKAEIIRVPMGYANQSCRYSQEYSGSYLDDKAGNMARVKTAINAAIAKDVYVIIDWHTHCSNSADASAYFEEMASLYGSYDNVIFEIFNEPLAVTWSSIKSYATTVINTIRSHSNNLILVGTPNWDQDVNDAASNPLADNNVAYVFHFYAASHFVSSFGSKINTVRSAGYPVFVSEYGTVESSGDGSHNATSSNEWMTFLNSRNISYCAWSVNNKNEAASFFKTTFSPSTSTAWTTTSNMTVSGQYIYNNLVSWSSNAPWHGGSGNGTSSSSGSGSDYGIACGGYYCDWPTDGCQEIRTDPDGLYGAANTSCTIAISNCDDYGIGRYSNSSCTTGGSSTRCKNANGYELFCEWGTRVSYPSDNPGCFAIDPTYSEPPGRACSVLVDECNSYGTLYYSTTPNSTAGGAGKRCNGTNI